MHQYKGKLIVHTGSMFSGKTSSLERDIKRFRIAKYNTLVFKPAIDDRYSENKIVTHDNTSLKAISIESIDDISSYIEKRNPDVIAIDEIQFLQGDIGNIIDEINNFLKKGTTVVIAGLDMDFSGEPFEIIKELMPISDYLEKHHAVCVGCGNDAWISHRKSEDDERILIGAIKEYEPLCRKCYSNVKKGERI